MVRLTTIFPRLAKRPGFQGLVIALLLGSLGCKSAGNPSDGSSGKSGPLGLGILDGNGPLSDDRVASNTGSKRDPLLGGHIPKQNLPTKPSEAVSSNGLPLDPLMRDPGKSTPTTPSPTKAVKTTPDNNVSHGETYRPGPGVTTAALAGGMGNELVIDDRRTKAVPAAAPVAITPTDSKTKPTTMTPAGTGSGLTVEVLTQELRKIGAKPYAPVKLTNGDYEFRCAVPINDAGAMRSYSGTGATPLAAVKNVYEQIRTDDRK